MHQLLAQFDSWSSSWQDWQLIEFVPAVMEARSLFSGNSFAHDSTEYSLILPGAGMNLGHRGQGNPRGGSQFAHEVLMCFDRQV